MFIQLVGCTLHLDNNGTLSSDNGGTGRLSKVTSSKLNKLIEPALIQLKGYTLSSDNGDIFVQTMVVILGQIMVVQDIYLKSQVVS